jgi:hypothetical protein
MPDEIKYPLLKDDLLFIESTLYETIKEELTARQFIHINTSFDPSASEIGYHWFDITGSAKIFAAGADATDIPFVGENGGREIMKVYDIVTGIKYSKAERRASQAQASLGKGPACNLDTIRVSTARRFISETENKLVFLGDETYNIKGLLTHPGVKSKAVAEGAKGSNAAEKRRWKNKTPQEKLEDLRIAKGEIEEKNIFKSTILGLSPNLYNSLLKPYSDMSPMTVLEWLTSQGQFFERIIVANELSAENNGFGDGDCFVMLDNRREVIELALIQDMELGDPIYDVRGTSYQSVEERTAGCIIRHPKAIYVGKGC